MCNFSQFLSATVEPAVALVSAANTTPSLYRRPTIVVPVLVNGAYLKPYAIMYSFLK